MKVKTFDTDGGNITGDLQGLTMSGLMTIKLEDGRLIVRHQKRCEYDQAELQKWFEEMKTK